MKKITNHRTNGEIGEILNHNVVDAIGQIQPSRPNIINHNLSEAAPDTSHVLNDDFADSEQLARRLGLFRYPGRALGSSSPNDIIQLHPDLRNDWSYIIEHYNQIGLGCTKRVIWDDSFDVLADYPDYEISVFFFGSRVHKVRPDNNWFEIVKKMNSKNEFIHLCQELSVPTPKTFCFKSKDEVRNFGDFQFPVFLKISESVSGLGVIKCNDSDELKHNLETLNDNLEFQIQEAVRAISFINLQYVIIDNTCYRRAATEQILNGCEHNGNRYPIKHEPWHIVDSLANYMRQRGMKGYFAFDLAITEDGRALAIECNPRYNGSTYPSNIAQKLNIRCWLAKNFKTKFTSLSQIDLRGIEYDRKTKSGVIVVNWGCVSDQKLGIMIAGETDTQKKLERELKIRL